ncbi:hypothetical protein [Corynebacterium aquilae]|uniref:Uncharacterized protein n=1 Tax=Corynebacterium aquilae DSM 44791 TaxID=1431546 RepID=A0A1L7CHI7_9CORY|nr:hypothetical protein [Corynebacterium aquilae]APT85223.1 hypothetical protein CAQU_09225 [Corynebacterium aquilae DSM 44791]
MVYVLLALVVWAAILGRTIQVWGAWGVARGRARVRAQELGLAPGALRGDVEDVPCAAEVRVEKSRALASYVAGRKAADISEFEFFLIRQDVRRRKESWRMAAAASWVGVAVAAVEAFVQQSVAVGLLAALVLLVAVVTTVAARSLQDMHDTVALVSAVPAAGREGVVQE